MAQKPRIQYIGEFYSYGSEARKVEIPAKPRKTQKPAAAPKADAVQVISVDPVAMVAIAVAVLMLVTMVIGALQLQQDWEEYNLVAEHLHGLNQSNREKLVEYRDTFDLAEIRSKAEAMGLVPKADVQTISIQIHVPEAEPEMTFIENIIWFIQGMFA